MADGMGCKCAAKSAYQCCCNVDWTPKEVYDLRQKLSELQSEMQGDILYNKWKGAEKEIKKLEEENKELREMVKTENRKVNYYIDKSQSLETKLERMQSGLERIISECCDDLIRTTAQEALLPAEQKCGPMCREGRHEPGCPAEGKQTEKPCTKPECDCEQC